MKAQSPMASAFCWARAVCSPGCTGCTAEAQRPHLKRQARRRLLRSAHLGVSGKIDVEGDRLVGALRKFHLPNLDGRRSRPSPRRVASGALPTSPGASRATPRVSGRVSSAASTRSRSPFEREHRCQLPQHDQCYQQSPFGSWICQGTSHVPGRGSVVV